MAQLAFMFARIPRRGSDRAHVSLFSAACIIWHLRPY